MIERTLDIPTPSGAMETFIVHPHGNGPHPAVVLYMDVWGIREELRDIARRIATMGYYCLLPDFYHRQGKMRHAYYDQKGRMISLDLLDEARRHIVLEPLSKLSDAMVIEDTAALLRFIDDGEPVRPGAMGAVGYCMGGRHVFRVAAAFPQRFRACASLHGSAIVTDAADSPHLTACQGAGEIYCGLAETDRHAQPEKVKALLTTTWQQTFHHELHKGADHGYALPDRDVHHKQAANRDWEIIFGMFRRQMPLSA
jgi:carboxymethylenebutenolidase